MDSHPVFSDFSHMTDGELSQLKFAVGLRTENADEAVRKMLPLSVITPGVKVGRGDLTPGVQVGGNLTSGVKVDGLGVHF